MHYLFLDETYRDGIGSRTIVVCAWAVDQGLLNDRVENLEELRQPGKAPILERVYSAIESLDALALVGWAMLDKSVFQAGVTDVTKDVRAMKRPDTIWSVSVAFAVSHLLKELCLMRQQVGIIDVYFDPRQLKGDHEAALENSLKGILVRFGRHNSAGMRADPLKKLKIRNINPVEKSKPGDDWTKFQLGTWMSHKLCKESDWIIKSGGTLRVKVRDMSEIVTRTLQQFEGKSFYD